MKNFEEYQADATKVPVSLRNNRDRVDLPIRGLQEEAGRIGKLLGASFPSGKFSLTQEQSAEVRDGLADILWYVALLCGETGITMQNVAEHSLVQLQARAGKLDPDRR